MHLYRGLLIIVIVHNKKKKSIKFVVPQNELEDNLVCEVSFCSNDSFREDDVCNLNCEDSLANPETCVPGFHNNLVEVQMEAMGNMETQTSVQTPTEATGAEDYLSETLFTTVNEEAEFWGGHTAEKIAVCPCAVSTPEDTLLMCLSLGLRHNLSWQCQIDILKLINAMYGEDRIPASKYEYLNLIDKSGEQMKYHIFCPECEKYFGDRQDIPEVVTCNCGHIINVPKSNYFLSVDLKEQFVRLLNNEVVAESIMQYRFNRKKLNSSALEDIYDGAGYKEHFENGGVLSDPFNFSISMSTDGVPMGKSGKTIWPIYATINELPPKERAKHVLLAGLYIGKKDPKQNVFLQPFVNQVNRLSTDGFQWNYNGQEVLSRVIPLCFIVDSVARFQVFNMSGINSYYACTFCYQKAEHTVVGQRFPPIEMKAEQRTAESTRADMNAAFERRNEKNEKKRVVKGVKGPCALLLMLYLDIINAFVPDYMHCVLLGNIRSHMELLFDPIRKKFWKGMGERDEIGIEHLKSAIDERFTQICALSSITRSVRSINQMNIWKASEWRSWLVFYCIPCLKGILKKKYLYHLSLLSYAMFILLQKSITMEDLALAEKFILQYVFLYNQYFGLNSMVLNVHLLTHLVSWVINWGPLWTHNAFLYEGYNRHLLQLVQSPGQVVQQIARKFLIFSDLPVLCNELSSSKSAIKFCESVLGNRLRHFVRCDGVVLSGKQELCSAPDFDECFDNFSGQCLISFKRMLCNGVKYSTDEYSKSKKHNDSCIFTTSQQTCVIKKILCLDNSSVLLLVRELNVNLQPIVSNDDGYSYGQVKEILDEGAFFCISPSCIEAQAVLIDLKDKQYVCKMPYGCYGD